MEHYQLECLNLSGCVEIKSLSSILRLSNLRELNLSGSSISNYAGLEGLANLKRLNLRGARIDEVSELFGLKGLEFLNVQDTSLGPTEIAQLESQLPETLIE